MTVPLTPWIRGDSIILIVLKYCINNRLRGGY